ncbi:MAG: diguanylate cyclase [Oscillospiraceae bacterium]|nr:diguanylate cyclase [Oscillospiraceae bacterium]
MEKTKGTKMPDFLKSRPFRYALATAIVLLSLLGTSIGFILRVYFTTESACYDTLAVETENAIAELEGNIRNDRTVLRVIAGMIGNAEDIDSIEVSGYLSNYNYNSQITQIGMLLPEDKLITYKGYRTNYDEALLFDQEAVKAEHLSSSPSYKNKSGATIIRSFVPIRKDGICSALLFSEANASSMAKAWLPRLYDKNGYCYVVNRKTGEIIINTAGTTITDIHDIDFTQTHKAYTKEGTINNILSGKRGYSVYRSPFFSEKLYMCYLPFNIEDWEMVVFVPESAVFSAVKPIRTGIYAMIVISVVLIVIYGLWLFREVRASIAETEQKANTDVLTGLQNRNRYELYLKRLEGTKDKVICLFIDANGLHELNNSKGHFAGDQMLRFIADTLKVQFSSEHLYRIGGDEFVVFLSDKTVEEVNEYLVTFNETLQRNDYHAAVGICVFEESMSVNQLIGTAEKNMYEAKQKYYEEIGKVMRA